MKTCAFGALAAFAAVALAVGCGSSGSSSGTTTAAASSKPLIVLVTDVNQLNDHGFNQLAYQGLLKAQKALGIHGAVYQSASAQAYIPNLSTAARKHADLVISVGFDQADAIAKVAKQFPDTKFAIIDVNAAGLKGKPKNVRGIVFAEQEAGCLAGVAAATTSKSGTISSVGGLKIPPVDAYIAGYQYCAKKVKPGIKTLNGYSQDFVAQDKCKELALKHFDAGSSVEFQVAGGCGLGVLDAAKEQGKWGIGVDVDQKSTAPKNVLASAGKKVDVGVYDTIQDLVQAKFRGGRDHVFALKDGGVGLLSISSKVSASIKAANAKTAAAILSGKLKPPVK